MIIKYIDFVKNYKSQIDKSTPEILICGLPIVKEQTNYCTKENKYKGATQKSQDLNKLYENYCKENKIFYLNNNDLQTGIDGVHLTEESHKLLATKLAKMINNNVFF